MSTVSTTLKVVGLGKQKFARFAAMARRRGKTPEDYTRELIEDMLAMDRAASNSDLDEFLRPVREDLSRFKDEDFDRLIHETRTGHQRRSKRHKR